MFVNRAAAGRGHHLARSGAAVGRPAGCRAGCVLATAPASTSRAWSLCCWPRPPSTMRWCAVHIAAANALCPGRHPRAALHWPDVRRVPRCCSGGRICPALTTHARKRTAPRSWQLCLAIASHGTLVALRVVHRHRTALLLLTSHSCTRVGWPPAPPSLWRHVALLLPLSSAVRCDIVPSFVGLRVQPCGQPPRARLAVPHRLCALVLCVDGHDCAEPRHAKTPCLRCRMAGGAISFDSP